MDASFIAVSIVSWSKLITPRYVIHHVFRWKLDNTVSGTNLTTLKPDGVAEKVSCTAILVVGKLVTLDCELWVVKVLSFRTLKSNFRVLTVPTHTSLLDSKYDNEFVI